MTSSHGNEGKGTRVDALCSLYSTEADASVDKPQLLRRLQFDMAHCECALSADAPSNLGVVPLPDAAADCQGVVDYVSRRDEDVDTEVYDRLAHFSPVSGPIATFCHEHCRRRRTTKWRRMSRNPQVTGKSL